MNNTILITGATGNVGGEVARLLWAQGQPVRAAVSSPRSAAKLPDPALPWAVLDFADPATYPAAFAGVDRLFLMRPPQMADPGKEIKPVIDAATAAGVRHIVFLSLLGVEKNKIVPHAKIEQLLMQGPAPYTMLRAGFFMQNLSTTHRDDIRDRDDIFVPAGKGKTAFVDVRDLAAVAVKALTEPGHENRAYPLTGSEALDYYQVAEIMTEVLGRKIVYSNPSPIAFAWAMQRRGEPLGYIAVISGIYLTTRLGMAAAVLPDLAQLLGRPPITMRQFVQDFAHVWAPPTA